jgi:hypothetical protein
VIFFWTMNVALVVIIALVIVIPVLCAGGVMMWHSYKASKQLAASENKERSVSTDVNVVDVEVGEASPRLRDLVIESVRRKRASIEGSSELSSMASTAQSSRREKRRNRSAMKKPHQLTKTQSDDIAATREPSQETVAAVV